MSLIEPSHLTDAPLTPTPASILNAIQIQSSGDHEVDHALLTNQATPSTPFTVGSLPSYPRENPPETPPSLPAEGAAVPALRVHHLMQPMYERSECTVGIVHVGVGAFHRAHQAVYIDSLLAYEDQRKFGLAVVNLRHQEQKLVQTLKDQNGIYTVKFMASDGRIDYRQVGSILNVLDWSKDPHDPVELLESPNVQLVTMTVTESGYYLDGDDKLDWNSEQLAEEKAGKAKSTIYAYLRKALKLRMKADAGKITLLSCDNLRNNGGKLKTGLLQYLDVFREKALLDWVKKNCSFPCCMVDRITPRPDIKHSEDVQRQFDIDDQLTVMCEPFGSWIIQDNFAGAKPAFDRVGALFVDDVEAFEDAKIRILNAGHTVVAYFGALRGYKTYDEAIRNDELSLFFDRFELDESVKAIGDHCPMDLNIYVQTVKMRFSNPNLADAIPRICMDGASKFAIFVMPTITGCYKLGFTPVYSLEAVASWYVFMQFYIAGKFDFTYIEPKWSWLKPLVEEGDPKSFASSKLLWGTYPETNPQFVDDVVTYIDRVKEIFPL